MAEIVRMPKLGFDMAEGTLVRWVIPEGGAVTKGAVLAEIETDKATVEVESSFDGVVARQLVAQEAIVPVNTPIAVVASAGETVDYQALLGESAPPIAAAGKPASVAPASPAPTTPGTSLPAEEAGQPPAAVKASPLARRMAKDNQVNLAAVPGTGPGGRIVKRDLLAFLSTGALPTQAPAAPSALPATPAADRSIPVNRLRAAIGRRMLESKQQIPHFYVTHEYDMSALMVLRKQVNSLLPDSDKLSVNDFIVKAAALALRQFSNLNAALQGEQVIQRAQVNIGVAVSVEGGLLTVVCKNADLKPVRQIAAEIRGLVARAREGKVRPDDIEGSTFSISNLGMFDVEHFIAIINPPEAAILAVGSVREAPVAVNGEIKVGLRMKATISVDHRVSDGAEAAQFLQAMAGYLENPLRLLI